MTQIRAFIALDLPQPIQDSIKKESSRLQKILGQETIRWTSIQNMHLTLKFLGNIPNNHVDFLKQMLTQLSDSHAAFDLQIGGIGSFPSGKLIRVLWLGIQPAAELTSLQRDVDAGTSRLGYEKEARAFSPHLTLGRVKQNIHPNEMQKIRNAIQTFQLGKIPSARVDSVHLYQSDLHQNGSVYTKLFSAKLS
ncbi:MAG TPA: RNA 2',3'-cyclic phosphodiesterase [Anaerolineae bacterium]|nr:RNA 2',3'-cyclic phosphodiesterase [Anaerolineae bacterium]